jgi:nucleotide-binding universal stress UspA family protein
MYQHILIPTDGSDLAEKAVSEGVKLAKALGARVTFLTVLAPLNTLGGYEQAFAGAPEPVRRQAIAFLEAESKAALARAAGRAREQGVSASEELVESPHAHEAIIETAQANEADLIVMASHGRGGAKAIVLGSVTQKVLSHTKLPVLVVR